MAQAKFDLADIIDLTGGVPRWKPCSLSPRAMAGKTKRRSKAQVGPPAEKSTAFLATLKFAADRRFGRVDLDS